MAQVTELATSMGVEVTNLNKKDIIRGIMSVRKAKNLAILKKVTSLVVGSLLWQNFHTSVL